MKLLGKNIEDHTNGETQDREIRSNVSKMKDLSRLKCQNKVKKAKTGNMT